jgi:tripartite-type tricarboxylate transporter receptor subunit TctC
MKRPALLLLVVVAMTLAIPEVGHTAAFPEKGRTITVLVPWTAGGSLDLSARLLSAELEKVLMTPVQVVNKPGASGQVGTTQIALAKPDGYTIGVTSVPSTSTIYLDPDRKAAFGRKDLVPVARHTSDAVAIGVPTESKYKTLKDLIDDAKARPEGIKVGCSGILSVMHLGILMFQKATGTKFAVVQFDGGAPAMTGMVGGHLDVVFDVIGTMASHIRAGTVRLLGIMDKEPSKFLPEVKTLESQGVKVYISTSRAYSAPAGTPKDIVDTLSAAIKKATDGEAHVKKLAEMYTTVAYLDAAHFAAYWDELDTQVKPLIEMAKQ